MQRVVSEGIDQTISALGVYMDSGAVYGIYGGNEGNNSFVQYSTSTLAPTALITFPPSWCPAVLGGQSGHFLIVDATFVVLMKSSSYSDATTLVVTIDLDTYEMTYFETGSSDVLWEITADPSNGTLMGSLNGDTVLASIFCGVLGCQVRVRPSSSIHTCVVNQNSPK